MADEKKPKNKRVRNGAVQVGTRVGTDIRKVAKGLNQLGQQQEFASAGKYTTMTANGEIADDVSYRNRLRGMRGLANSI